MDYNIIADYHIHTNVAKGKFELLTKVIGTHAKSSLDEIVEVALSRNLKEIAITDHGMGHIFYGMKADGYKYMRENINNFNNKLKNKNIDFKILLGIEANIISSQGDLDIDKSILPYLDLICAGYHHGCKKEKGLISNSTEALINTLKNNNIAILHHPCDKIAPNIIEVGKVAATTGTAIELNRKHGNMTVAEAVTLKEFGVKFALGSDSHSATTVGTFGDAINIAKDAKLTNDDLVNALGLAHHNLKKLT